MNINVNINSGNDSGQILKILEEAYEGVTKEGTEYLKDKEIKINQEMYNNLKIYINELKEIIIKYTVDETKKQDKKTIKTKKVSDNISIGEQKQLSSVVIQGHKIIQYLRTILTGEDLKYLIRASTDSGRNKTILISQKDLYQSGFLHVTKESLNFTKSIEKLKSLEKKNLINQYSFAQLQRKWWPQVEEWGTVSEYSDTQKQAKQYNKHNYYKKVKEDKDVYVGYYGTQKKYVYRLNTEYNMGWLHEWLGDYFANYNDPNLILSNRPWPLAPIFEGKDQEFISGFKGGDYAVKNYQNGHAEQIQNKNNSDHITSINHIYKTLDRLEKALDEYYNNKSTKEIKQLFIDNEKEILGEYSSNIDKTIDETIKKVFIR